MVNEERLENVLKFISTHRELHDQRTWVEKNACGTTGCLAGWGGMMYAKDQLRIVVTDDGKVVYEPEGGDWWELGASVFGLDWDQAEELFYSENSLGELWALANEYTDGAIEIPEEFVD